MYAEDDEEDDGSSIEDDEYEQGEIEMEEPTVSHHYGAAPAIPSTVTSAAPVTVLDDRRAPAYTAPSQGSNIQVGSNGYALEKKAEPKKEAKDAAPTSTLGAKASVKDAVEDETS